MSLHLDRLRLALALLRREYAVQYAGMGLGLAWMAVQYLAQIAVFLLVFGRGIYANAPGGGYASRLLVGMLLWLPLSEMLTRSTSILIENRALIRRISVGRELFPWLPPLQALVQYSLLAAPVALVLLLTGDLSPAAPLAFALGLLVHGLLSVWAIFLARSTILLRDLGPIMRPGLQALFWLTPIAYYPTRWSGWNPLTWIFQTHSRLWLATGMEATPAFDDDVAIYATLSLGILTSLVLAGSSRLRRIVEDQL